MLSLCLCQKGSKAPSRGRCRGPRGTRTLKAPIGTVKAVPSSTTLHSTAVNSARCHATPELSTALYCSQPLQILGYYKQHPSRICQGIFPCQSIYKSLWPAEEEPLPSLPTCPVPSTTPVHFDLSFFLFRRMMNLVQDSQSLLSWQIYKRRSDTLWLCQ